LVQFIVLAIQYKWWW